MTPDTTTIEIGCFVWTKGAGEFGDGSTGGMCVDVGIDPTHGRYVIALVPSPSYSKTSHRKRAWLYSRVDGLAAHVNHGQVSELRRFYLSDLAPCDGFRDATKMQGYSAKALLAAGVAKNVNDRGDLLAAYQNLCDAVLEMRAEARGEDV